MSMPMDEDPRTRIVAAAREAFHGGVLAGAPLSQIAGRAGVARQNLYRYFPDKEALVKAVVVEEIRRINLHRRETLPLRGPARELIVDALLTGALMGAEDEMVRAALQSPQDEVMARLVASDPDVLAGEMDYWAPVLALGRDRGEVRSDLSDERIVRWFMTCQMLCASRPELVDGSLRTWLSDFVVAAVVARP